MDVDDSNAEICRPRARVADLQAERQAIHEAEANRGKKARTDGDFDRCSRFHSEGSTSALCCLSRRCGSRYGLRGVRVGETFHPGPRRRRVIPSTDHDADSTFYVGVPDICSRPHVPPLLSTRPQNITQYRPHIAVRANCPTLQPTRRSVML